MGDEPRGMFLFGVPSFADGAAQVFALPGDDFVGVKYSSVPGEADWRAVYQDWAAVGDDLLYAAENVARR